MFVAGCFLFRIDIIIMVTYSLTPTTTPIVIYQNQTATFTFRASGGDDLDDIVRYLGSFINITNVSFTIPVTPNRLTYNTNYELIVGAKTTYTILSTPDFIGFEAKYDASKRSNQVTIKVLPNTLSITSTGSSTKATATGFIDISGDDLSEIFAPLEGSSGTVTNYIVKNYGTPPAQKDLNQIFSPISSGSGLSYTTGFKVNGTDLNAIFAKYQASSDFIVTTAGSGSKTVSFPSAKTAIVILVGGGGGGGSGSSIGGYYYGGTGGAGGEIHIFKIQVTSTTTINYTIGSGGAGEYGVTSVAGVGQNSTITIGSTTVTARGGGGGGVQVNYSSNAGGGGGVVELIDNATNATNKDSPEPGNGGVSFTYNEVDYSFGGGGGGGGAFFFYNAFGTITRVGDGPALAVNGGGKGSNNKLEGGFGATSGSYGGGGGGGSRHRNSGYESSKGAAGGTGLLMVAFT